MVNWDQLLPDLLTKIVNKVDIYEDFVAFGGVCRSWRSVAVEDNFIQQQLVSSSSSSSRSVQHPWLMLAEKETETHSREFANLSKEGGKKKFELPEAVGKWCIGSMGWLITLDKEGAMELLHPLTRARIPLPHLRTFRLYEEEIEENGMAPTLYLHRATLSASPSVGGDYYVMIILGITSNLAFWRPGDAGWTSVETGGTCFYDVIYHKNKFYAVSFERDIVVCDVRGPNPTTAQVVGTPPSCYAYRGDEVQLYLAECCGELFLVKKILDMSDEVASDYWTCEFQLFKVSSSSSPDDDDSTTTTTTTTRRLNKWEEVNDLGETSIFVGYNTAISVPSAVAAGFKPNCVYFTDDYVDGYWGAKAPTGGKDMGIYNLATRSIEPLYHGTTSLSNYCPPIWVSPSF